MLETLKENHISVFKFIFIQFDYPTYYDRPDYKFSKCFFEKIPLGWGTYYKKELYRIGSLPSERFRQLKSIKRNIHFEHE
jgi:hypothetical protein